MRVGASGGQWPMSSRTLWLLLFAGVAGVAAGVRLWVALFGPLLWGYDAWGHVAYVLFLDLYRSVPFADQGWSYFHPPLHYALGWLLAQAGSGEVLARGLAVLGSAASLGTAAIAAWLARRAAPGRPELSLLAFAAVAFQPVHLGVSPMPGNALTHTFLSAAAVGLFVRNEMRGPRLRGDAAAGLCLGLALLTRFTAVATAGVLAAALALRVPSSGAPRILARAAVLFGLALALAGPYYARNVSTFGTPFQLSRDFPLVARVESAQPPGERTWRDFVRLPVGLFRDPDPMAPHLLRSVWGTVYLDVWAGVFREDDVVPTPAAQRRERRWATAMALLGLLPTALFGAGTLLALGDVRRGRRRAVYGPLLLLGVATGAGFALFAWQVPTFGALKGSYLLGLSLPYGVFAARGAEGWLARVRARPGAWLPAAAIAVPALVAVVATVPGWTRPRRADAPAAGALHFYFGEYAEARRVYGRLVAGAPAPHPWLENLAAVELAAGNPDAARRLYARARELAPDDDPWRAGRLAVAAAVAGDLAGSRALLDRALERDPRPELLANRGAVRAAAGDLDGAAQDLRAATRRAPHLLPAWRNLARVEAARGDTERARAARARAAEAACRAPRGYPHGVGTGEVLEWGVGRRWLLLLEDGALRPAPPAFFREACVEARRG